MLLQTRQVCSRSVIVCIELHNEIRPNPSKLLLKCFIKVSMKSKRASLTFLMHPLLYCKWFITPCFKNVYSFPLFMIKSIKTDQIKSCMPFFSHLVCLHALIFITQNETYLTADSENSVYMNHKCCNTIHIFIYMCISCRPIQNKTSGHTQISM